MEQHFSPEPESLTTEFQKPIEPLAPEQRSDEKLDLALSLCQTEEGKGAVAYASLLMGRRLHSDQREIAISAAVHRVKYDESDVKYGTYKNEEIVQLAASAGYSGEQQQALRERIIAEVEAKRNEWVVFHHLEETEKLQDEQLINSGAQDGFLPTLEGAEAAAKAGKHEIAAAICNQFTNVYNRQNRRALRGQGDPTIFMWMKRRELHDEQKGVKERIQKRWDFSIFRYTDFLGRHGGAQKGPFSQTLASCDFAQAYQRLEVFLGRKDHEDIRLCLQDGFGYRQLPDQVLLRVANSPFSDRFDYLTGGQFSESVEDIRNENKEIYPYLTELELVDFVEKTERFITLLDSVDSLHTP